VSVILVTYSSVAHSYDEFGIKNMEKINKFWYNSIVNSGDRGTNHGSKSSMREWGLNHELDFAIYPATAMEDEWGIGW
jgi:hypothetical protein